MVAFLETEREVAGWRFLLLWLVTSTIGFTLGLAVEFLIFPEAPNLYITVAFMAIMQAWVINRHISIYLPWAVGTILFWVLGAAIAFQFTNTMQANDMMVLTNAMLTKLLELVVVSAIAGIFAGIPQWIFMRDWLPKMGIWWLGVSAIGWALMIPGLVTGLVLMQQITREKVPMAGKRYQMSGDF